MSNRTEQRSRRVVDKVLQRRIIAQVSWPMALVMVITAGVLIMFGFHVKNEALNLGLELTGVLPLIFSTTLLFGFAVASQILIALIVSHRIAGAAYRIRQTLQSFRSGDLKVRVHLRQGDLHTQLAEEVNGFLDWVETGDPRRATPLSPSDGGTPSHGDAPRTEASV